MIRVFLGLYFIAASGWFNVQGVVFEDESRHHVPILFGSLNNPIRQRPQGNVPSSSIDNILQIPISVIQGTSAAAQSWNSQSGDTVNKVFDIPVQTLQAVGNIFKDRLSNQSDLNQPNRRQNRRERLLKIREMELKRRQQILEQQQSLQQQKIQQQNLQQQLQRERHEEKLQYQREQSQQRQNEKTNHSVVKRHSHLNVYGWASALSDVLLDEFVYGHGGLFNGHGGHGNLIGGHGNLLGHKKKKKKKKKPVQGTNFGIYQNIWSGLGGGHGGHGGHGGGHGGHGVVHGGHGGHGGIHGGHGGGHGNYGIGLGNHGSHGSNGAYSQGQSWSGIYGGLQQILGGNNHHQYEVTENLDDHVPQGIFSWQQPQRDSEEIQNKIAPGYNDRARSHS